MKPADKRSFAVIAVCGVALILVCPSQASGHPPVLLGGSRTEPTTPDRRPARGGKLKVVDSLHWFGSAYETPESGSYVGMPRASALHAARVTGIEAIRVFEIEGGSYTFDLRPDRLDLLIKDDVVVAAGFF